MSFVVLRTCAMKRGFRSAIAIVNDDPVSLFGEFHSLPIGKLIEAPKWSGATGWLAVVKAVCTAILLDIGEVQISITA